MCGGGEKVRQIYCVDKRGGRVQDDYCASQKKPSGQRKCGLEPCEGTRVDWMEGYWSEVSINSPD